ncbi:MAG: hypothetical protein K2X81_25140 [Candidatus Obscuribacterales bacterium]|nr:hypothetical protein [Candidatus Obscuribacterales bacterium]
MYLLISVGLITPLGATAENYREKLVVLVSSLNSQAYNDRELKDTFNRSTFVSRIADLKTVLRALLKEKGGPIAIARVNQTFFLRSVSQGLQGDNDLALLYLDVAKHLDERQQSYVSGMYAAAMQCRQREPLNNTQANLLDQKLKEIHKLMRTGNRGE